MLDKAGCILVNKETKKIAAFCLPLRFLKSLGFFKLPDDEDKELLEDFV